MSESTFIGIGVLILLVAMCLGMFKSCDQNFQMQKICIEKNWHIWPNDTCHSEPYNGSQLKR